MKRTALLLTALAALWAAPAHAQTDFVTLQENVDASGTALMCPTRANNYVDCADAGTLPVPSVRGRAAALGQPRVATAPARPARMGLIGICPAASHLPRKLVRQPSAFVGGIVPGTRML